ncbi:MAG: hypothetical protein JWN44_1539 [Myxococcales bacterium]|nr:hypothetical protein [Myxococcales bacterium]
MLRAFALSVVFAGGVVACGNSSSPPMPDMARAPTEHPPLWHIKYGGGPTQPAPEVYTVVWQGQEALGAEVADFNDWMLKSDYWKNSLAEYGIGAGSSKGLIVLPMAAPDMLTDSGIQDLAKMLVSGNQVVNGANTQIAFVPPATTTVLFGTDTGCDVFAGYHRHINLGGSTNIFYSVNLLCAGESGEPIDRASRVLSHEIAETATDPLGPTGYVAEGPVAQEVSDLCNFAAGLPVDVAPDAMHPVARRYWVQRQYSGQAAVAGDKDPCIPVPWDRPYWNVAIDPETIPVAANATGVPVTARLAVFAYGDVGLIKWVALSGDGRVSPDHGEAHAGDTIPITITLSNSDRGPHEFDVFAESEKAGGAAWFSYVTIQ